MAAPLPDDLVFVTEEYPPFSYLEGNVPSGLSVDLITAALTRVGMNVSPEQIRFMAWSDAYRMVRERNNTGIFSIARTNERERDFLWVGPLMQCPVVFFATNETLKTKRPDKGELKAVVILDDIGEKMARDAGIPEEQIFSVTTPAQAIQRLVDGTSDVWVYAQYPGESFVQTIAEDPQKFFVLDDLGWATYYLAFNKNTDPQIVEKIQEGLNAIKQDRKETGTTTYEQIVGKYIGPICTKQTQTREQIMNLVNLTADAIRRDAIGTRADIQNGRHPYKDRNDPSLYVFVYDTSVTVIANAAYPELAGTNFSGKPDVFGKKFRDEIVTGAMKQGSGFVQYSHSNPVETGIFKKEVYYMLVTGSDKKQYIVCAGRYLSCDEK